MTLLCWGLNSHAKSQNLNQGYGYMKIFKTEQRKLKFDKGGYWPKSIIPNLLSVKEQPKNQESEVHMGKHWQSFLGAVKNRQKHVNTRRFIYLLQYFWKKPWETETKRVGQLPSVGSVCAQRVLLQVGVHRSWSLTFDDVGDVSAQLVFALCYCELCLQIQQHTRLMTDQLDSDPRMTWGAASDTRTR